MPTVRNHRDARIRIAIACAISVVLCFVYAATRNIATNIWYQSHAGGVPYVVFWILFVGIILPTRRHCLRISTCVVVTVCGLEFLQLWQPEPLVEFRRTHFGAALLGSTFAWHDLPPYFIGGAIGGVVLWRLGASKSPMNDAT